MGPLAAAPSARADGDWLVDLADPTITVVSTGATWPPAICRIGLTRPRGLPSCRALKSRLDWHPAPRSILRLRCGSTSTSTCRFTQPSKNGGDGANGGNANEGYAKGDVDGTGGNGGNGGTNHGSGADGHGGKGGNGGMGTGATGDDRGAGTDGQADGAPGTDGAKGANKP